jgi:hypothetical protein
MERGLDNWLFGVEQINEDPETYAEAVLVKRDFSKAFDVYQHEPLRQVLKKYRCPEVQLEVMMDIMSRGTTRVLVNGFLSEPITIDSGVKQGDPASAILFAFGVSLLASNIIEDDRIKGIKISTTMTYKIGLAADDTLTGAADLESERRQAYWCKIHCDATGSILNEDKSVAFCPHSDHIQLPYRRVSDEGDRYLGFILKKNGFSSKVDKIIQGIQDSLKKLPKFSGELQTKVVIWETYMLSYLFWHTQIEPLSTNQANALTNLVKWSLWYQKAEPYDATRSYKPNMSLARLQQPKKQGGLDLPDLEVDNIMTFQCTRRFLRLMLKNADWCKATRENLEEMCTELGHPSQE